MSYKKDLNITKEIPAFRKILNYLTPSRNDALVTFRQTIDLTKALPWMAHYERQTGRKIHLLHLFLMCCGLQFYRYPRLNRYVCGNRFYQRDGVTLSVSAKKKLVDGAKIVLLKLPVYQDDTLEKIQDRFAHMLGEGRAQENIYQEKEMNFLTRLPPFLLRFFLKLLRVLDRYHLLPGFFVDPDPLYTSMIVANLGSVGLDAAYHHLYEYGNCPFFAVIGKMREEQVLIKGQTEIRTLVDIKYSFDERVEDGLACAFALSGFKELLENPDLLQTN